MKTKRKKTKPVSYYGNPSIPSITGRTDHDWQGITFSRMWAMPNHETFLIPPIAALLERYVGDGRGWADPFAGNNSPAQFTNDLNPEMDANEHIEAKAFGRKFKKEQLNGILFDPPYSFRQVSEHYRIMGKKATRADTSMAFFEKVKSAFCDKIKKGGYAISLGWNSSGFGIRRGFQIVEILLVPHGGTKHDTIVVVEKRIK